MLQSRTVEIWVGLFIAAGMAALFMLAMQVSNLTVINDDAGYSVTARFENISGLKVRSPVTMAGVRLGRVTDISFDPKTFQAVVTMNISNRYKDLPLDTSAAIYTSGLLGEQYVGLEPGGDFEVLKDGDEIMLTQSAVILEQMIGQLLFSKTTEGEGQ
ncbi:MAG TPA: outer membrane lipid asymmetry maintenance protein MlaD [Gammaproteobacteria bacterium]